MNNTTRVLMLSLMSVAVLAGCKKDVKPTPPADTTTTAPTTPTAPTTSGVYGPNDLDTDARSLYLLDMACLGDAVLQATDALRMNYEILGNAEPELHCHLFARYASEPEDKRRMPVWFYDWKNATPYSEDIHGELRREIARLLEA